MDEEAILATLIANRHLNTQEELDTFLETVKALYKIEVDLDYVMQLFGVFVNRPGSMHAMSALEEFITYKVAKAISIEALMRTTGQLASNWVMIFYTAFLVLEENGAHFKSIYGQLSDKAKAPIVDIFKQLMEQEHELKELEIPIKENIKFILGE